MFRQFLNLNSYFRKIEIWGFVYFFLLSLLAYFVFQLFFFFTYFFTFILFYLFLIFFRTFQEKPDFPAFYKNTNSNFSATLQEPTRLSDNFKNSYASEK